MTKQSPRIPPRDMLPSARPDHYTKALDETYERGFHLGRAAGLERACAIVRDLPYSDANMEILALLTQEKYKC